MAGVVDTSAIIALERSNLLTTDDLSRLFPGDVVIASITAAELFIGIHRTSSAVLRDRRERAMEWVMEQFAVLPFGLEEARLHARLSADLMAIGQRIGAHDLLIAATALTYGYDVVTHNVREFQRIPGLIVHPADW